jgi:LmbE family N-acetylglucosaminyl deacetylase
LGVSGHLDHIAVSITTTFAHLETQIANKLYYYCIPKKYREKILDKYFIYFPEGYDEETITTKIDFSHYWKIKAKAMFQHKSQMKDVIRLMTRFVTQPKIDHFILQHFQKIKPHFPETDLFEEIK